MDPALCCPLGGMWGRRVALDGAAEVSCDLLRTQTLTQESLHSWQLQVEASRKERLLAPPEPKKVRTK